MQKEIPKISEIETTKLPEKREDAFFTVFVLPHQRKSSFFATVEDWRTFLSASLASGSFGLQDSSDFCPQGPVIVEHLLATLPDNKC